MDSGHHHTYWADHEGELGRFPVLKEHFSHEQLTEMFDDDHTAWNRVCTVLISVISAGVLLAAGSVIAVVVWPPW